jgi:hypothetical protein
MLQRLLCTVACTMVAGCLGEPMPTGTVELTAREEFTSRAWPALGACIGCHGKQPTIDFLAPGTADGAYGSLFEFQPPVVDLDVPGSSLILTMGKHTGPAFTAQSAADILSWLESEREERSGEIAGTTRIGPFMPAHGTPVMLDLGVGGATLTIVTEASERGLYAKRITLTAGSGIRVRHPLFVSRPLFPIVDDVDRFADVDLSLAAGTTVELGPAWFLGFSVTDYVAIHFAVLEGLAP